MDDLPNLSESKEGISEGQIQGNSKPHINLLQEYEHKKTGNLTQSVPKYNNFVLENDDHNEEPISTMKQEENKFVKSQSPRVDVAPPQQIPEPEEDSLANQDEFPGPIKQDKGRRRSSGNSFFFVSDKLF